MVFEQIGRRMREERKRQGMTQEQLAERASVNESYIGQIERGIKNPSLESLIKIVNALGVTIDYLLKDVNPIAPNKLANELSALAKGRTEEEIRLLININRMIVDFFDSKKG